MSEPERGDVRPAMTAEEWARQAITPNRSMQIYGGPYTTTDPRQSIQVVFDGGMRAVDVPPEAMHALAALCLHGQPFGFTREDVEGLRALIQREGPRVHMYGSVATLVDRIEALLPPEDRT